jgi:hypothetical protein
MMILHSVAIRHIRCQKPRRHGHGGAAWFRVSRGFYFLNLVNRRLPLLFVDMLAIVHLSKKQIHYFPNLHYNTGYEMGTSDIVRGWFHTAGWYDRYDTPGRFFA